MSQKDSMRNDICRRWTTSSHLKWIADGIGTLKELSERLDSEAQRWAQWAALDKIVLTQPVDDGHIFLMTEDEVTAREFRFDEVETLFRNERDNTQWWEVDEEATDKWRAELGFDRGSDED
jgi:hypothetical protein